MGIMEFLGLRSGKVRMDLRKKLENMTNADIEAIIDDIAALKRDVAKALTKAKDSALDGALDSAQDMADELGDEVAALYKDMSKRGHKTAKAMGKQVGRQLEEQPVASLLVAFGVGFLMSKVISR